MSRQFPAFRGLAILLVVLNHAVTLSLQAVAANSLARPTPGVMWILEALRTLGVIAVPIFLFLSGGYLAYALQAGRTGQAYRTVVLGLRFILVPYLLWSLVFYGLLVVLQDVRFTLPELFKNLLVGYPYNFIPLLVFYYILAPLLMPVARRFPWILIVAISAYQLFSLAALQSGELGFLLPGWASRLTLPALRLTIALWGVFFPLGMVYGQHSATLTPRLRTLRPLLLAGAIGAYVLALLHEMSLVRFPLAALLCPVFVVLSMPVLAREWIPFARGLERLGMRAYGIYLTNLILLSLAVAAILAWVPELLQWLLIAVPLLAAGVIVAQAGLQSGLRKLVGRQGLRWVFG
jgi:peptidoglycan/LPS O-acetylase OafA/YrhL